MDKNSNSVLSPLQRELGGGDKQGAEDGDQIVGASLLGSLCIKEPAPQTWLTKGQADLLPQQNTLKQEDGSIAMNFVLN